MEKIVNKTEAMYEQIIANVTGDRIVAVLRQSPRSFAASDFKKLFRTPIAGIRTALDKLYEQGAIVPVGTKFGANSKRETVWKLANTKEQQ